MGYISPIYGPNRTMQAIMQANEYEIDNIRALVTDIRKQLLPQTATWGLIYWENLVGIPVNERVSYQDRRNKVIAKIQQRWPITPAKTEAYISNISGGIPVAIVQNVAAYTFRVDFIYTLHTGELLNLAEIAKTIESVKPAHLAYQLCVAFQVKLDITEECRAWLFSYPLCNVYKTGTYPDIAVLGKILACPTGISGNINTTVFDYVLAGTKPIISTLGTILKTGCDIRASLFLYKFDYELCGTDPVVTTKGHIEKTSLNIKNELKAARFSYPECGGLLCGASPTPRVKGHEEETNLGVTGELKAARFLCPPTGELLCGTYPAA